MSEHEKKEVVAEGAACRTSSTKKPYSPPTLRHLGSVRNLTLASGGTTINDAIGTFFKD